MLTKKEKNYLKGKLNELFVMIDQARTELVKKNSFKERLRSLIDVEFSLKSENNAFYTISEIGNKLIDFEKALNKQFKDVKK